jgi:hypothetical protein
MVRRVGLGIVVPGVDKQAPSEHFSGHFPLAPASLVAFAAGLIDGRQVTLAEPLDIIPFEADPMNSRIGMVDTSEGAHRAFIAAFRARAVPDLTSSPASVDRRGTPILLNDFHTGPRWEIYNCYIVDFTVWSRDKIYGGELPAP